MNTDIPDHYAPPRLRAVQQQPEPDPPPPAASRTDLEHIAAWIASLTYGDMKALAAGVLGEPGEQAQVIVLADKLHAWAQAKVQP